MMKKLILLIVLSLTYLLTVAQEWSIHYAGAYPAGCIHFHDGFIDEAGVTFLAGQEGANPDTPDALFMRIESDGNHTEFKYAKEGFRSRITSVIELPDHNLFAAGNLYGDTTDYVLVLILDKQLDLLEEKQYEKEMEGNSFGPCRAAIDSHGHAIVSTVVTRNNAYQGIDYRGVFFKFDPQGNMITSRYLIEDYPDPLYFLTDFRLRQMWYKPEEDNLLCLAPGYGNVLSFITFDSAFNYIDEYQIWQDDIDKSDHTLSRDCYTDYWYNEDEALFFSSRGDADHNKLRVSRVNTHGEILEYIHLNERTDTIDDAAQPKCMATANDSTFYFNFYYHTWSYYPGTACVYLLNDRLEIIGRHVDDEHHCYRSCMVLATADGGCLTVNDSCNYNGITVTSRPIIQKLTLEDFETIPLSIVQSGMGQETGTAFPNPCDEVLHIPIPFYDSSDIRCLVTDQMGRIVIDTKTLSGCRLDLIVSRLRTGLYHYRIHNPDKTLLTGQFYKK